jgi:hypothetical protein
LATAAVYSHRSATGLYAKVLFITTTSDQTHNEIITRTLIPWSRSLIEKLIVAHPLKKFSAYYGTR